MPASVAVTSISGAFIILSGANHSTNIAAARSGQLRQCYGYIYCCGNRSLNPYPLRSWETVIASEAVVYAAEKTKVVETLQDIIPHSPIVSALALLRHYGSFSFLVESILHNDAFDVI
jgi:hypothetical protein